jgi:GTP-binding protein EngB required for normal cell division
MAARKKKKKGPAPHSAGSTSKRAQLRSRSSPTRPVVTPQQVLENDARPLFEQAIRPWLMTPWTVHDYGMDAVVEVLSPRSNPEEGYYNTGRRIGIQLKASGVDEPTRVAVEVKRRTINYWSASHDPFAVVFCHVPTRRLVYRWVDDTLIAELAARDAAWFTHETLTIYIPWSNALLPERLDEFERESRLVVVRRHRVLAPGTYERLLEEAQRAMREVLRCASEAGFGSIIEQLNVAEERVRKATYVVALAGRMRAGKSTLFNALIRREISPVARRPTTAVPLFVTAGAVEDATISFIGGKKTTITPTAEALAEYGTQDDNPDNEKQVRIITVRLVSERLERGIAILDAPGLFDPSSEIQNITARALASANAVLFVMDVSSARTGGFAVESHTLAELQLVLDHSERVFLLLNKADELSEEDRADVTKTLERALARRGLGSRLAHPPLFISAKKAWDWTSTRASGPSPLAELEAHLWDYLLTTDSTGVTRLESAVRGSVKAIDESLGFLKMRRATSGQARSVQGRLAAARRDIADLRRRCAATQDCAEEETSRLLNVELQEVPHRIGDELRAAPSLPDKQQIAERVFHYACLVFDGVWGNRGRALEQFAQEVSEQLEAALGQVRLDHDPATMPVLLAPTFDLPAIDQLAPEAWGFGALGALLTYAVAPAYAFLAGIGSFFFGAWLGKEKQRAVEIAKIEGRVRSHMDEYLAEPAEDFLRAIRAAYGRLDRYVQDRWSVFKKDAQNQLAAAGSPLTPEEAQRVARLEHDLASARRALEAVVEEIRWMPTDRPAVTRSGASRTSAS